MYLRNIDTNNTIGRVISSKIKEKKYCNIIPFYYDFCFKAIFCRNEYICFSCKLLSYLLNYSYNELLDLLDFTKNETGKKYNNDLDYRNDLVLTINDLTIDIEMNNYNTNITNDRNLDYVMRLRNDKKSKAKYKTVLLININNYSYDAEDNTYYYYSVTGRDRLYTEGIYILDIYLPNIIKRYERYGINELDGLEKFLLVGMIDDKNEVNIIIGDDELMKLFRKAIENFSKNKDNREEYDKEWEMRECLTREGKEEGIKEGIEKGIEQGIQQERTNIIINLLSKGMSVKEILDIINISEDIVRKYIKV